MNKEKIYLYISALVLSLTLTFSNLSFLAWISIVPFMLYINKINYSYKEGYKIGIKYFTIFNIGLFSWILELYPLDWLGVGDFLGVVILIFAWIGLSIMQASIMAFIIPVYKIVKCNNIALNIISLSFIWIIFEWIQSIGILAMPWGRLAISQGYDTYLIQSASIFGILFVSFLILIVNGSIAGYILSRNKSKYLYIAVGVFISNLAFGVFELRKTNIAQGDIDVTLVQGNISSVDKWSDGTLNDQVQKYLDLTIEGIESENTNPEIVVWPETAITTNLMESKSIYNKLSNFTEKYDTYLMTGAFYDKEKNGEEENYNSIYTIDSVGNMQNPYSKRHLVPFGEYIPFKKKLEKFIPAIKDFQLMGELDPGDGVYLQETEYGKIGGIICFESIFPNIVRSSVNEGAELIVLVSNDSWFKDSSAVYQHHKQAIMRAVENNRYIVRAANTGISSFIDNKGRVIEETELLKEEVINSKVTMISKKTIYSVVGDIIVLFGFIWLGIIYIRKKYYSIKVSNIN